MNCGDELVSRLGGVQGFYRKKRKVFYKTLRYFVLIKGISSAKRIHTIEL